MPLFAVVSLQFDPMWPWSLPGIGLPLVFCAGSLLAALTILTYRGAVAPTRLLLLLALRLLTVAVTLLVNLRPSVAIMGEATVTPSRLLVCVDGSTSMNVADEFDNKSRWDHVRHLLTAPAVRSALDKLRREQRMEIVYYQGAESLRPLNIAGKAEGKRTEIGLWLHDLWTTHGKEENLRGLVMLSDGADNGTRFAALSEAGRFSDKCPISVFAVGQPTTAANLRDIAITNIFTDLEPVPVKSKLSVKGLIDAPGFQGASVDVSLSIADSRTGKLEATVPVQRERLDQVQANEVKVKCDAPSVPGEYKVTMRVEPLEGEATKLNNEISTYITVTKKGINILWVDGRLRYETRAALQALGKDRRFHIEFQPRLQDGLPFKFDKQYDILVIGDITAARFSGGDANVFRETRERVTNQGMGLLMLGGFDSFANSDWPRTTEIASLLPVTMDKVGQHDGRVRVTPTDAGAKYLLRLTEDPAASKNLWETILDPLDGMTYLGTKKETGTLLASREGKEPILVSGEVGKGRILLFAGSTTYRDWRRSGEAIAAYNRFWQNLPIWLAHQENAESAAWIKLDLRRLAADSDKRVNFSVGLRGQSGALAKVPHFQVTLLGPNDAKRELIVHPEYEENRGVIDNIDAPGEYTVKLVASGKDSDGRDISPQTAEARFLAFSEDRESLRTAADHELLEKLATAGGGRFYLAGEDKLLDYLQALANLKESAAIGRTETYPDWRRTAASDDISDQIDALWHSAALPSFLLFVLLLSAEWVLRRRWGLV